MNLAIARLLDAALAQAEPVAHTPHRHGIKGTN